MPYSAYGRHDILEVCDIPGGPIFSRSFVNARHPVSLDDALDDDDYTGLFDVSDDHDSDEGDLEREEERNFIYHEVSRQNVLSASSQRPTWDFPLELAAGSSIEISPALSSRSIETAGCSLSPILASSSPSSPIFDSSHRTAVKPFKLSESLRRKAKRKAKKMGKLRSKIDWSAIPREVLQQPYGGKEGPSRGSFRHKQRSQRSLGFLDKNNQVHFRLSKASSHNVRQRASMALQYNSTTNTSPCTPVSTHQKTLPPSSLTDLNFFDGILALSAPGMDQRSIMESGVMAAMAPPLSDTEDLSSAESSVVPTPVFATPRSLPATIAAVQDRLQPESVSFQPLSLFEDELMESAKDDICMRSFGDLLSLPEFHVANPMDGDAATHSMVF